MTLTETTTIDQRTGEIEQRDQALELALHDEHPLQPSPFAEIFVPRNLDEAMRLCDMLSDSELVPKDFQRKPANCFVAIQCGAEIGLKPIQSLWNIAVINGRPALWGDAQLALVRSSPHCEYVLEGEDADGTAVCRAKRRGEPEQMRTFSVADQKTAGLLGKAGPHTQYPKRMRQLRARGFALRDVFTDVLKGIPQAEEVLSIVQTAPATSVAALPRNATPAQIATTAAATSTAPTAAPSESLTQMRGYLEDVAKNKGSEALAAAWKNDATKADRLALAGDLGRLKGLAADCDELARVAAADAAREEQGQGAGDGQ